jgi:two-component system chemotaxis response regulator CheB
MRQKNVRVLVVDDSPFVRETLTTELRKVPAIDVVGSAGDPYEASELLVRLQPDVMTLDVEMPHMNGPEFLRKLLPQWPIPVIMVSACTARGSSQASEALCAGAVDVVFKPRSLNQIGFNDMMQELVQKIRQIHAVQVPDLSRSAKPLPATPPGSLSSTRPTSCKLIAIGASTGGPQAIATILRKLPRDMPPVVIAQHLPLGFSAFFAKSLGQETGWEAQEAMDGMTLQRGQIYVAPCGMQTVIKPVGNELMLRVFKAPHDVVTYHPAVDVLFHSVAQHVGRHALGILLTGMGRDGAKGLKSMRDAGAHTIGQDEATSVVYGMPQEAKKAGAVVQELPLTSIGSHILRRLEKIQSS